MNLIENETKYFSNLEKRENMIYTDIQIINNVVIFH